ncbi:DNA/RNA non-specific endonuclease domain-containing protein [Ditylenchus destructor]|nr:DNA/RNA non-specific endonuclease domain-containing protein [Ditylenchus destructor]
MRKFAAIAAASGASFLVGSLISPQLNDLLPKINSPLFQQAQAASALAVANPTDVLTNLTNKPSAEMKLDDEFWKKPSRASEIMKFGYPGFDNLRTFEDRMTYDASVDRSKSEFKPDNSIHPYFRSQNSDYFRSGYDRGHLAAAGNHRRTQKSIDETFYLVFLFCCA